MCNFGFLKEKRNILSVCFRASKAVLVATVPVQNCSCEASVDGKLEGTFRIALLHKSVLIGKSDQATA